jgi:hypothetical protein
VRAAFFRDRAALDDGLRFCMQVAETSNERIDIWQFMAGDAHRGE